MEQGQCHPFVHRDVIGLVALDLVLRFISARVMDVSFVMDIQCVHLDDRAADMSGF